MRSWCPLARCLCVCFPAHCPSFYSCTGVSDGDRISWLPNPQIHTPQSHPHFPTFLPPPQDRNHSAAVGCLLILSCFVCQLYKIRSKLLWSQILTCTHIAVPAAMQLYIDRLQLYRVCAYLTRSHFLQDTPLFAQEWSSGVEWLPDKLKWAPSEASTRWVALKAPSKYINSSLMHSETNNKGALMRCSSLENRPLCFPVLEFSRIFRFSLTSGNHLADDSQMPLS